MKPENLKNYGIAFSELSANPPKITELKFMVKFMKLLYQELGFMDLMRFMKLFSNTAKKMQEQDFSKIREKGLNDEKFIKSQIELTAMYSSLSEMTSPERATGIFKRIMELVGTVTFPALFPSKEEFSKFDDPFEALKKWFLASVEPDRKAGCHFYDIVENSSSAFQINCTYCAWYEIAKLLGFEKMDICYADDVFFPDYLKPLKIKFKRKSTLSRGGHYCDFRFEKEQYSTYFKKNLMLYQKDKFKDFSIYYFN